jgi:glycerol-3-phosphate dehydrogenase (NAD(P)+)
MKITVLGAGAWGTALAASVAPRHASLLWARDAAQAAAIAATHRNERYLPGVALPTALRVGNDLEAALAHAASGGPDDGLIVIATPMAGLREMLARCAGSPAGLWWLCKGFEAGSGALGHEVAREVGAGACVGVLSGPSFALEVARGQPTALVAASSDALLRERAVEAFHGESLRIYTSDDPVGVEVGGAVKNVIAIATGIADGMHSRAGTGLGLNARAALITRGLAEMTRLGLALGARADTFMGLSGLGDLVLTATGDLSRNRQVGLQLAAGRALPEVLAALGHVAEGVYSAPTVLARSRALGVEMPLTEAVVAVLQGNATPAQALVQLMRRDAKAEAPHRVVPR